MFWTIFICMGTTTRRKDLWNKGGSSTLAKQKHLVIPQHLQEKGGGPSLYKSNTFRYIAVWESLFHGTRWVSCLLQAYQFKSQLLSGISAGFAQYESRLHRPLTLLSWSCSSKIQNCQRVRRIPTRNTTLRNYYDVKCLSIVSGFFFLMNGFELNTKLPATHFSKDQTLQEDISGYIKV